MKFRHKNRFKTYTLLIDKPAIDEKDAKKDVKKRRQKKTQKKTKKISTTISQISGIG